MKPTHSIQRELTRWIILIASVLMVVGGIVSSSIAFLEAKDLQDSLLREIGGLVRHGYLSANVTSLNKNEGEEISILIQPVHSMNSPSPTSDYALHLPTKLTDGLQTLTLNNESWRVLVISQPASGKRYIVAQQTELRDDLAIASGLNVFLPILILVTIMQLLIHWMIKRQFKPLNHLANQLYQQNALQPKPIANEGLPTEISPFVTAINELLDRIGKTLQKQQRFIADAAHELRTPVAALSLQAENVEKAPNEKARVKRQKHLHEGLLRLRSLLNQLLDLARLQSDKQNPKHSVSLKAIISQIIAELHPLAEKSEIDLGVTKLEDVKVLDQDEWLCQLVRNAIDNAIRYTPRGGKVNISLNSLDGKAVLHVEDTGKGIPEEVLTQVFEPFYRNQNNTQLGSGLGLTISQEIAQRLGGKISLRNRPEGGLIFTYTQARLR